MSKLELIPQSEFNKKFRRLPSFRQIVDKAKSVRGQAAVVICDSKEEATDLRRKFHSSGPGRGLKAEGLKADLEVEGTKLYVSISRIAREETIAPAAPARPAKKKRAA